MHNTEKKNIDVLFILPPYHFRNGSGLLFPLGIGSIMACLDQRSLSYEYIDCTDIITTLADNDLMVLKRTLLTKLLEYNPCLIGIGPCVTPGAKGLRVVAECCKQVVGTERIFAGGPFATLPSQDWFFYENLGLKYTIKGEGELAVCEAVEALKKGHPLSSCPHVSTYGHTVINQLENLDDMPFPKRMNPEKNQYSDRRRLNGDGLTAHIVASRGCPYHCIYCVSGNMKEIAFRRRSVANIVAEMKFLQATYGVSDIIFYDDCFFTSAKNVHREIESFCCELKKEKVNLTWQIEIRPDILMSITENELIILEQHGCRQMNIGIEKTNPDGAAVFGKKYDYSQLCDCLSKMHKICKIRTSGTFILGGKAETEASVYELIQASTKMCLDDANYSPLFVYPDTPLYNDLFSNPKDWLPIAEKNPIGEVIYENDCLSKERLLELVTEANQAFFFNKPQQETERVNDRFRLEGGGLKANE